MLINESSSTKGTGGLVAKVGGDYFNEYWLKNGNKLVLPYKYTSIYTLIYIYIYIYIYICPGLANRIAIVWTV